GTVLQPPSSFRGIVFQVRPEFANPRGILDVRVRQAIAYSVDKQAMSEALHSGQAILADTPVFPDSTLGPALDGSIPRYPLDLRSSERLLNQAGFSKGPDGFYRGTEGRLAPLELTTTENPDSVRELAVLGDRFGAPG